jgi:very-short-patch-repair endonuclease
MNQTLAPVARGQDALFTLGQATASGLSLRKVQHCLESGLWEPVHAGVYRVSGAPRSWEQEVLAACLAAGPHAVASHRAAAALWELDGVWSAPVELTVPLPRGHRLPGVIVHRSTDLDPSAATRRHGIPVTPPARTLVDLGAVVPARVVERALEAALGRRLVTLMGLRAALDSVARRGRRGAGVLRGLLEERSDAAGLVESTLEARFLRICREHGLPAPLCQHEVRVGRRLVGRVDFAFPAAALAVEVDGYESHATLAAFQHDRARQNELVAAGWTVLRFTWDDVVRQPERVATAARRVLCTVSNPRG